MSKLFAHDPSTLRRYVTQHGSSVEVSGTHQGVASAAFDWFEEPNACCDCHASPYPEDINGVMHLIWSCDVCGGGQTALTEVEA